MLLFYKNTKDLTEAMDCLTRGSSRHILSSTLAIQNDPSPILQSSSGLLPLINYSINIIIAFIYSTVYYYYYYQR